MASRWKKIVLATLIMSLGGTVSVYADTLGSRIRVLVDDADVGEAGYLVDGKAVLPLRQVASALKAMVVWNDEAKKVILYKPNVHILLYNKEGSFGAVPKGNHEFSANFQVDNLLTDIYSFRAVIVDPYGKTTEFVPETVVTKQKENFWFTTKATEYDFKYSGKYKLNFYMKQDKSQDFEMVSQKVIYSKD